MVDDDTSIREFVSVALLDEGYDVRAAPNGAAALQIIRGWDPHLILLDMRMPVMSGAEFAAAYRKLPGPRAPILVMTAARDAAESAAQIRADGYVAKPFDLDDLLAEVARFLRRRAG